MNRKCGTSTGLVLLCTAAVMATAAIANETVTSIGVSYVATDLANPAGAKALYRRIQRAARLVCQQPDMRELPEYRLYQQCFDRAVDEAVAKVDSSAVTALHHSKTHSTAS
jgi:UrcA family protein